MMLSFKFSPEYKDPHQSLLYTSPYQVLHLITPHITMRSSHKISLLTGADLGWNRLEASKLCWALLWAKYGNLKHTCSPHHWKEGKNYVKLLQAFRGNAKVLEVALNCQAVRVEAGSVSPTYDGRSLADNILNQVRHPQLFPEWVSVECF